MIADISAQIERYAIRMEQQDTLLLRKVNRIRTIHSSLAIEGNSLSEDEVATIIEGKSVVAPLREIKEVKNAIATYDAYNTLNPYSVADLLRAHGLMMNALTDDAGHFRQGGVGVFEGDRAIHIAPPAQRVPILVDDLFQWLKTSQDHLLIKSCVFHYEFEFIHPFNDGNGRMGRLWQSLILGQLNPIFHHLPIENMVYANQEAYYDAIAKSTKMADSGAFIDFMLSEILATLKLQKEDGTVNGTVNGTVKELLQLLDARPTVTLSKLAELSGKSRRTVARYIKQLQEQGRVRRIGADKSGRWEVIR